MSSQGNINDRLLSAADQRLLSAARNGDYKNARAALISGAKRNCKDGTDRSPIFRASVYGHLEIVRLLLTYDDTSINMGNLEGLKWTPLMEAAWANRADIIQVLLADRRCDPLCLDSLSSNALHEAVRYGSVEAVMVLLSSPLQSQMRAQRDNDGNTPEYYIDNPKYPWIKNNAELREAFLYADKRREEELRERKRRN